MFLPILLLDKEDGLSGGGPAAKVEKFDDDTTMLNDLLDNKDKEEEPEKKEEEEKELITDEDIEEKIEPEEEEKEEEVKEEEPEEVTTNARAVDLKKIREKYPDFAKTNEFRELRNAYYREGQFSELFPTVEDAKEAAENNETFEKLNDALINRGDVSVLLNAVKEADPEAVKKMAGNFLDAVAQFDINLYTATITPVVRRLARQIYGEGQKILKRNKDSEDGQALVATARNIMQYAFEDPDAVEKDEAPPKVDDTRERQLAEREAAIRQEKFTGALKIATNSVERHLDQQILNGLDPDNSFDEFTRDALLERIKKDVKDQISSDQLHVRRMGSLWKRAEADGYSQQSLSRIVSAYLERARPIIPSVRNKFRGKVTRTHKEEIKSDSVKLPNKGRTGRAPENDGKIRVRDVDTKKIDYSKTSDNDIFEGKIKLKG